MSNLERAAILKVARKQALPPRELAIKAAEASSKGAARQNVYNKAVRILVREGTLIVTPDRRIRLKPDK